ncbi:hypothetical protein [Xanthomonas medicagonis]|uniref:hypothetical protein n=1 Tax=Xanthomonas medicagonis TaxID=3160841 RepID=UPI003515082D
MRAAGTSGPAAAIAASASTDAGAARLVAAVGLGLRRNGAADPALVTAASAEAGRVYLAAPTALAVFATRDLGAAGLVLADVATRSRPRLSALAAVCLVDCARVGLTALLFGGAAFLAASPRFAGGAGSAALVVFDDAACSVDAVAAVARLRSRPPPGVRCCLVAIAMLHVGESPRNVPGAGRRVKPA